MTNSEVAALDLLYTAEVAELLNVDPSTVQRMARKGTLKPVVKGKGLTSSLLFARSDVEAELARRAS